VSKTDNQKGDTKRKRKRENDDVKPQKSKKVLCPNGIYIGKLSPQNTEAELKKTFSKYGEIQDIFLHKSKHFCYITYKTAEQATEAINNLNGSIIGDASIKVQARRPVTTSTDINVKNISPSTTFPSLVEFFSKIGLLSKVQLNEVPEEKDSFAVVGYTTLENSAKALELDGSILDGRRLRIQYQRPRNRTKTEPSTPKTNSTVKKSK